MKTFRNIASFMASFLLLLVALPSHSRVATYYPNQGDLYYDGQYYLDSYMLWEVPGNWLTEKPGYEHDLWIHDSQFFVTTCTSITTLPDGYDDCPTAGVLDPNGPVFSFGTFDASKVVQNKVYAGAWFFSTRGVDNSTPFNLQAQVNENKCAGLPTMWCMFSVDTTNLIVGYHMNWLGYPTVISYYKQ